MSARRASGVSSIAMSLACGDAVDLGRVLLELQVTAVGRGSVMPEPDGPTCGPLCWSFPEGTLVVLRASPEPGNVFAGWSGECAGAATCTVTMTESVHEVGAAFEPIRHPLAICIEGDGAGIVRSALPAIECAGDCIVPIEEGTTVALSAAPDAFSDFTRWTGDCAGDTRTCFVTLEAPRRACAEMQRRRALLGARISGDGDGRVVSNPIGIDCPGGCEALFALDSAVRLDAIAALGSRFSGWSGACTGTMPCSVQVRGSLEATAVFDRERHRLRVAVEGGPGTITSSDGGIDCGTDCEDLYTYGAAVALEVTAGQGFVFDRWSGDCAGSDPTCSVLMTAPREVRAGISRITPWFEHTRGSTAPIAREQAALTYDSDRDVVVLFGGEQAGVAKFYDTWEWDGLTWTRRFPRDVPVGLADAAMAYDARRRVSVLFGGNPGGAGVDDTWEWDGTTWTRRNPVRRPAGRGGHGMVYDAARGVVLLFGGSVSGPPSDETWAWDGMNWTERTPRNRPPPRYNHGMAYDPVRQVVVVFGGLVNGGSDRSADTWEWDGSEWTEIRPAVSPSPRSGFYGLAFHPVRNAVIVFGGRGGGALGDTWAWDGTTWSPIPTPSGPQPRSSHGTTTAPGRRGISIFGGVNSSRTFDDLWELR